jgi:uncharacterized iron-regulated protein
MHRLVAVPTLILATALTAACAHHVATPDARLATLLPAQALLLGEQHDAPDHQRVQRELVQALAARGALAALTLEMAEQGVDTRGLPADASEAQVQAALQWDDAAWPWRAYGPVVMAAVRAGVPVLGANLPRAQLRARMAETQLDTLLPAATLQAQQQAIRQGHCDLLPERQIVPLTRVQIARDVAMAQTVRAAAQPGRTVLLLAGRGHVDRSLGVPQHLPPAFKLKAVAIGSPATQDATESGAAFDASWPAAAGPAIDHCAQLKARIGNATPSR